MPQIIVRLGEQIVQKYVFDKPLILIGRALDNDLIIENLGVSRRHAQIELIDDKHSITDLHSANGTYVNGERVEKRTLVDQDIIIIGKHKLFFSNEIKSEHEELPTKPFDFDKTIFVAKIETCFLTVLEGKPLNHTYKIDKPEVYIGRDLECEIVIHDWLAAKKHARLIQKDKKFILTDLGTWKGTKVNGQPIKERFLLNKDEIEIGFTKLKFLMHGEKPEVTPAKLITPAEVPTVAKNTIPVEKSKPSPVQKTSKPIQVIGLKSKEDIAGTKSSMVFHLTNCKWMKEVKDENRITFASTKEAILSLRKSCSTCKPGREEKDREYWQKISDDENIDDTIRRHAAKMISRIGETEKA